MKHKIEAIDYLRGFALLSIILSHVIAFHPIVSPTLYSKFPFLLNLRSLLNYLVVTIVICSGFSLYLSHKNLEFNLKSTLNFYKKRFKKLLIPLLIYVIGSILIFTIINLFFKEIITELSTNYSYLSIWNIAGIPLFWIINKWIIYLMLILTVLFPFLKFIYEKIRHSIVYLGALYLIATIVSILNPIDVYSYQKLSVSFISAASWALTFILGWSIIYILGFYIEQLYKKKRLIKKELWLTFNFVILSSIIHLVHRSFNITTLDYANKFPPTPHYLSIGVMSTFILLNIFFAYKHFIHIHLRKIFSFFSSNSYWLFLWSLPTVLLLSPVFAKMDFINIYVHVVIEFIVNCILVTLMVLLQKKLIRLKMHSEKHHF